MNNHEFYVQQEAPRRQRTVETINKIVYDFGKFFSVIAPEIGNFFQFGVIGKRNSQGQFAVKYLKHCFS